LTVSALAACRAAAPEQRQEQQLRDSFAQQIASIGIVRDFHRDGDTLSFSARYGHELDAKWRVQRRLSFRPMERRRTRAWSNRRGT